LRDDVIVTDDTIDLEGHVGDIRQYECNSWRMAGRIFMKFVFEIMPLEPSPKSHFLISLYSVIKT
jgi:hypothetical protein